MMAKPIRALELHNPMIQFLIIPNIIEMLLSTIFVSSFCMYLNCIVLFFSILLYTAVYFVKSRCLFANLCLLKLI